MKIKIKLSRNEMKALYICLQETLMQVRELPHHQERQHKLKNLAQSEILTALFLRLTMKMENLLPKNTISIKMTEAWTLNEVLQPRLDFYDDYTLNIILKILGIIHQKTA
jgi:hypothetical protein